MIRSACDEAESKASNAASDPQSLSSVRVLNYEVTTDPIKMYQHSHLTEITMMRRVFDSF